MNLNSTEFDSELSVKDKADSYYHNRLNTKGLKPIPRRVKSYQNSIISPKTSQSIKVKPSPMASVGF